MIFGTGGCFFPLPLIPEEENVAPEIVASSPPANVTVEIKFEDAKVFVVTKDDNGDNLVCEWSVDGAGSLGTGEPLQNQALKGCEITITRKDEYADSTLRVTVFDPSLATAERSWPIALLEASR